MNPYWDLYSEAARLISFDSSRRISHKLAGVMQVGSYGDRGGETWITAAEEALWPMIYSWHYLRERRSANDYQIPRTMREHEDSEFIARLAGANNSSGVLDNGWSILVEGADEYLCEKNGLCIRAAADCVFPENGCVAEKHTATIRFPAERRYWMPGYYHTGGGATIRPQFRVYFNVRAHAAPWLLRTLSKWFEASRDGYELKLLNNPRSYSRPDAAVLYLSAAALESCRAIVRRISEDDGPALSASVPALAKRIQRGIAVADEPPPRRGRPMSFGEHRCRIVARGLARAHADGRESHEERLRAICREFEGESLDAGCPYASARPSSVASQF